MESDPSPTESGRPGVGPPDAPRRGPRPILILGAALPGAVLAALAIATRLRYPRYHDEALYLPVALDLARGGGLGRLLSYEGIRVVTGPAIFLIYAGWLRAIGDGLAAARALSALLAASSAVLVAAIGRRAGASRPVLLAAGLVVLPQFLLTGLTFLSESLTLCAALLGTWLWLRGVERPSPALTWLAAVPLAVAVNVRMTMLAAPLALCAAGVLAARRWSAALAPALAVAAQVPLWIAWGGIMPPAREVAVLLGVEPRAGLHIDSELHMITIVGFLFWPALGRARPLATAAWSLLGLALYYLFTPDMGARYAGPLRAMTGPLGWPGRALLAAAFLAGWNLVAQAAARALSPSGPVPRRSLALVALAVTGIYAASPLAFDRYSLTFSPFWLLCLAPGLEAGPRRWAWAAWVLCLAAPAGLNLAVLFGAIDRSL